MRKRIVKPKSTYDKLNMDDINNAIAEYYFANLQKDDGSVGDEDDLIEHLEKALGLYYLKVCNKSRKQLSIGELTGYIWLAYTSYNSDLFNKYKHSLSDKCKTNNEDAIQTESLGYALFCSNATDAHFGEYLCNKIATLNKIGDERLSVINIKDCEEIVKTCFKIISEYEKEESIVLSQLLKLKTIQEDLATLLCCPNSVTIISGKLSTLKSNISRLNGTLNMLSTNTNIKPRLKKSVKFKD